LLNTVINQRENDPEKNRRRENDHEKTRRRRENAILQHFYNPGVYVIFFTCGAASLSFLAKTTLLCYQDNTFVNAVQHYHEYNNTQIATFELSL
jgi:hypothetical protein